MNAQARPRKPTGSHQSRIQVAHRHQIRHQIRRQYAASNTKESHTKCFIEALHIGILSLTAWNENKDLPFSSQKVISPRNWDVEEKQEARVFYLNFIDYSLFSVHVRMQD